MFLQAIIACEACLAIGDPHLWPTEHGWWYPINAREFTYLFHPLVSVFKVHPLCPFTAKERFVVFFCSVAFNFVWTAFMEYHRGKISVLFGGGRSGRRRGAMFYLVKNIVTTLYAVLIRQIVICPCLYGPLIQP